MFSKATNEYGITTDKLERAATRAVQTTIKVLGNNFPQKQGAFVFLLLCGSAFNVPMKFGEVPDDKRSKYKELSQEKARRLSGYHEHISSFQSRNEDEDLWGGAVRFGDIIASTSGFNEYADEIVSVLTLNFLGIVDFNDCRLMLGPSNNRYWDEIVQALCGQ